MYIIHLSHTINYNKTHNSQLKYEIKYDLYKIAAKYIIL